MGVEIERRFLVSIHSLPAGLDRLRHLDIEQGYTDGIRLRRSIDVEGVEKFETCIKKGSGWVRIENKTGCQKRHSGAIGTGREVQGCRK